MQRGEGTDADVQGEDHGLDLAGKDHNFGVGRSGCVRAQPWLRTGRMHGERRTGRMCKDSALAEAEREVREGEEKTSRLG